MSPELLAAMDAEHDTMAQALVATREAMADLARTPTREQADSARAAFEHLRTVTVAHLDHEESELEQVYLDNEEHPAIVEMGKAFGKVSPARGAASSRGCSTVRLLSSVLRSAERSRGRS